MSSSEKTKKISAGEMPNPNISRLEAAESKALAESSLKYDLMKPNAPRADLMKMSGMVGNFLIFILPGLNKPYRAPIYRNYWECIQGLYR